MCEHHYLDHPDGLVCTRTDPHQTGHVYRDSSGSYLGEGSHHAAEPDEG